MKNVLISKKFLKRLKRETYLLVEIILAK